LRRSFFYILEAFGVLLITGLLGRGNIAARNIREGPHLAERADRTATFSQRRDFAYPTSFPIL
jgi:hypothetical protein